MVDQFRYDPRFHYLRSSTKGLGRGHNAAIALTQSELIAITDDDCVVPPNWLSAVVGVLAADERVGVVFGSVLPCDYDATTGYVPVFERTRP